jgi:enoyl-CoA hydratase/carnithine racemase
MSTTTSDSNALVSVSIEAPVATLTLNRPERLNALTAEMVDELLAALADIEQRPEIRAIVLTGAGRGFCAGADISGWDQDIAAGGGKRRSPLLNQEGSPEVPIVLRRGKPVIAAINGPAVGVGITMTLPMDVRIASDKARMGFVFAKRGIVPEACSSWFLPRAVGINQAAEWVYTGRIFPAEEALAARLVSRVVAPDDLIPTARALAREMADGTSAMSVALARQLMWKMLGADHPMEAHKVDSKCIYWMGRSADAAEGVMSFLEKRPPQFKLKPSIDMPDFYPWWPERKFR